jgi:hypothetical protein
MGLEGISTGVIEPRRKAFAGSEDAYYSTMQAVGARSVRVPGGGRVSGDMLLVLRQCWFQFCCQLRSGC